MGERGGLVQVDVDRDHELERCQRGVESAGVRVGRDRVAADDDERTITLSLRAAEGQDVNQVARPEEAQKRVAPRKIGPSLGGAQATLGDALKDKLGALKLASSEEEDPAEAAEEAPAEAEEAPAETTDAEEKPE